MYGGVSILSVSPHHFTYLFAFGVCAPFTRTHTHTHMLKLRPVTRDPSPSHSLEKRRKSLCTGHKQPFSRLLKILDSIYLLSSLAVLTLLAMVWHRAAASHAVCCGFNYRRRHSSCCLQSCVNVLCGILCNIVYLEFSILFRCMQPHESSFYMDDGSATEFIYRVHTRMCMARASASNRERAHKIHLLPYFCDHLHSSVTHGTMP